MTDGELLTRHFFFYFILFDSYSALPHSRSWVIDKWQPGTDGFDALALCPSHLLTFSSSHPRTIYPSSISLHKPSPPMPPFQDQQYNYTRIYQLLGQAILEEASIVISIIASHLPLYHCTTV